MKKEKFLQEVARLKGYTNTKLSIISDLDGIMKEGYAVLDFVAGLKADDEDFENQVSNAIEQENEANDRLREAEDNYNMQSQFVIDRQEEYSYNQDLLADALNDAESILNRFDDALETLRISADEMGIDAPTLPYDELLYELRIAADTPGDR